MRLIIERRVPKISERGVLRFYNSAKRTIGVLIFV